MGIVERFPIPVEITKPETFFKPGVFQGRKMDSIPYRTGILAKIMHFFGQNVRIDTDKGVLYVAVKDAHNFVKSEQTSQTETTIGSLFALAANQGYAFAQYNLGLLYEKGQGVTKNDKEAARLYTLAAKQGDLKAIDKLKSLSPTSS